MPQKLDGFCHSQYGQLQMCIVLAVQGGGTSFQQWVCWLKFLEFQQANSKWRGFFSIVGVFITFWKCWLQLTT